MNAEPIVDPTPYRYARLVDSTRLDEPGLMSGATMTLSLRKMTDADLDEGVALTQKLKWSYRRADWQQALQLGEGVAVVDKGKMRASALCWRWGDDYATLGLVIVADELQGRGVGRQLMLAVLEKLACPRRWPDEYCL